MLILEDNRVGIYSKLGRLFEWWLFDDFMCKVCAYFRVLLILKYLNPRLSDIEVSYMFF